MGGQAPRVCLRAAAGVVVALVAMALWAPARAVTLTDTGPHHIGNTSGTLWTPSQPDGSNRPPYGYSWRFDIGTPWTLNSIQFTGVGNLQDTGGSGVWYAPYDYGYCLFCQIGGAQVTLLRGGNTEYSATLSQQNLQNGGITLTPGTCLSLKPGNYTVEVTPGQVTGWYVPDGYDDIDWSAITLAYTASASGSVCGGGSAGPFNAYTPGNAPYIFTQVAGTQIPLTVEAYRSNGNPDNNFRGTVTVTLMNASNNSGTLDTASNCRSSWTTIGTVAATASFNRQATASVTLPAYPDVLRDAVVEMVQSNRGGGGQTVACSTDHFAIRPDHFTVQVSDPSGQVLNATSANGTPVYGAGKPFQVRIRAWNSQGQPTPGYQGPPQLSATASVLGASLGTLTVPAAWSASNGQVQNGQVSYSEVGAFTLQAQDTSFAAVDASDPEPASRRDVPPVTVNVGRFVPADFRIQVGTAPVFATACGGFTYIGQPFGFAVQPVASVTALDAQGQTTTNYTGSLFKLSAASVTNQTYADANGHPVDQGSPPAPTVRDLGGGKAGITFATDPVGIAMTRAEPPVTPYDAQLSLSWDLRDADGVAYSGNPFVFNGSGGGIAFNHGAQMRYGRLLLVNAYGPQQLPLSVPIEVQYYASLTGGNGFVQSTNDTCTTGAAITPSRDVTLDESQLGNGSSGQTSVMALSISGGAGDLTLSPAAPATGKVGIDLNLNPSYYWLMPDLNGNGSYQDPAAIASFGLYSNGSTDIYRREVVP